MKQMLFLFVFAAALAGCNRRLPDARLVDGRPEIFPDYIGVTAPCNIAPLNFKVLPEAESIAVLSGGGVRIEVSSGNGAFDIPLKKWRRIAAASSGASMSVEIYVHGEGGWLKYAPFGINISKDSIDPYLAYRRIPPGYRMWSRMGIYERRLGDFSEETFLDNKLTNNNCMNCHSFCMQDPDKMLFHQRSTHGGTYFIIDGEIEKLDTKTERTVSAFVYPSWHPSGRYVAFSTNDIKQDFHFSDPNRIEVFDNESDIVVYDIENHEIITDSLLFSSGNMETFPAFSPDGKTLYFCSAPSKQMPESYREMKYSLLSLPFDPEAKSFGKEADTLYDARVSGRSARFPRVSPDGRFLLFTVSDYGNFSIWHKDADLRMLDLQTLEIDSLPGVNSGDAESYHSWSGNSRWFVFSSRRGTGLYTRPYICHVDEGGIAGKPFLLPQKEADYYATSLYSFNVPELVRGKINVDMQELIHISKYGESKKVSFGRRAGD